jgi:polar amino acid transport system substrate-binding protein
MLAPQSKNPGARTMSPEILAQLAPTGVLRAGINMGNFLLVTGRSADGGPEGVSPSMARAIADKLGVPVKYVPYARPSELADAAGTGAWDIGLIGAEPQRAEKIAFTAAYCEIEATYLVPPGSPITAIDQVDRPGNRIVSSAGAAYTLWLERNIKRAELVLVPGGGGAAFKAFLDQKQEVYAGLRPGLLTDVETLPGARILDGQFMAVQQAIGTARANTVGAAFLHDFVEQAKASGLVAGFIAQHKVRGLSVAPAA